MKCNKCGGEMDMDMQYLSYPPQYKCKSCGNYQHAELKPGSVIENNIRKITSTCKCCDGVGIQTKNDGIKIRCPECDGSGMWDVFPYKGAIRYEADWTVRKDKRLTNYKVGDFPKDIYIGDYIEPESTTFCDSSHKAGIPPSEINKTIKEFEQ